MAEVQNVQCDATGGAFGLAIDGETAYISHDADANDIKESLEALSLIDGVSILFNNGKTSGCAPFDDESAGATDLADAIDSALEASDTIQQDGVVVAAVDLVQGGHEKILSIRWQR